MFPSLRICVNCRHKHMLSVWRLGNNQPGGHQGPQEQHSKRNGWAEPGLASSLRSEQGEGEAFQLGEGTGSDLEVKDCSLIVLVCLLPGGDYFNGHKTQILHFFQLSPAAKSIVLCELQACI